tara:strand:+ start:564 stop:1598 length:1035 start_codon:yes stop_codon:yes gene_type:complete
MSSLLDQAIIDAKELREAAMKSAEQSILERYAPEVKKAVETILNTEETVAEEAVTEEVGEISLGASDGENLCPCPDAGESQEVEIDFAELEQLADEEAEMSQDDLAMDLGAEDELALQEDANAAEDVAEEEAEEEFELSEEIELEEEEELEEEIKLDFDPTAKLGWFPPAESQEEYRAEMEKALDSLKEKEEELEENKNAQAVTENKNLKISKALVKLQEKNEQYTNVILALEEKINELLLINSRLLFTNRVLESISLNERQKTNLVEAISKARTPEEAKTIFESLKNVVGSISQKQRGPQSLREATQVPFTGQVGASRRQQSIDDDVKSRMQKLAGIGNNIQE